MSNAAPEGWKILSIGSVLKQEKRKFEMQDEESYPLLSVRRRNGGFFHRETRKGKQILTKTLTKAIPDSFVISKMQVVHGACGLIDKPFYNGYLSASYVSFMAKDDQADLRYFNYLCQTPFMYELFLLSSHGVHIEKMTFDVADWLRKKLALPPLPEQQKIAAILSSVDDVIEKTRAQIDKLKDLKAGMMQELLTKGIGHTAFKDSPVGRIPEGWDVCMASEVADEVMVGVVIKPTQYYVDSGVPALRSANVREDGLTMENLKYFSKESNELLKKSKLRKGDLLTVRTGYPGTTAVVTENFEGCNCIDVVITRPSERMNSDFFSLWVNSDNGKGQVLKAQGGLAQQHFNVGDMKNLLVAVPPLEEQKSIFNIVDSVTKKISIAEVRLEHVRRVKKALMQDLLTGKVRVNVDNKENAVA